jgi:hypothetical protein
LSILVLIFGIFVQLLCLPKEDFREQLLGF